MNNVAINLTHKAGGEQISQAIDFAKYFTDQRNQFRLLIYITKQNLYMLEGLKTNDNTKVVISNIANKLTIIRVLWEQCFFTFHIIY
tara:strand:+ start:1491 stop:1751 length:261 start_codon:yes stop_codon:yes gene_type:complete